MSTQIETGKPNIMYKDHVNRKCNQNNLGVIKSSDLCVSGDTPILTQDGYVRISDVVDKTISIWDTTKFVDAPVRRTGMNQKLVKVITDDGCELKCTEYHRFDVMNADPMSGTTVTEARDLEVRDTLPPIKFPVIKGNQVNDFKYPYTHGYYCGNGIAYYNRFGDRERAIIYLYYEKATIKPCLEFGKVVQFQ